MESNKRTVKNDCRTENSGNKRLRRYKYLKIEPAMVGTMHLRFVLLGCMAFSVGIVIGFNIKDILIRSCVIQPFKRLPAVRREVAEEKEQEPPPRKVKPLREEFKKLPDKFLIDIPMPPPATVFPIRPWKMIETIKNSTNEQNVPYFMTMLVKSAVSFARRRFQIRQTWGSLKTIEGKRISVVFVIGLPTTKQQQNLLEKENSLYGDMVQGDVSDTYRNLPLKVLSGYQFVVEYLGNVSEYFVSTDDDCFINIPNSYEYFTNLEPEKRNAAHCGYVYSARSDRISNLKSKWGVAEEIYPMRPYPKFCHGGMTVLSFDMLRDIYRASLVTNYTGLHLEDVLTNGILRERLQRGDESIRPVYLRDKKTNRKLPLMWHLGYRKDKDAAFLGLWRTIKRRFGTYDGPFDPQKGYRTELATLSSLEGRTLQETIDFLSPVMATYKMTHKKKS